MKTIKVSDEMYNSLIGLSKELNTQDHRSTAMPYFFQIRTEDWKPTSVGNGEEVWHCDGSFLETEKEIKEAIFEYNDWHLDSKADNKEYLNLDDWDKDTILENNYSKVDRVKVHKYENAFLTEKACKEHIKANHYHYNEPVDYLAHAFRNSDMETVLKFLCELNGGKFHK